MAYTATHKVKRMELKAIKGIGPAKQDKLRAAGITDVASLARADVAKLSSLSGIPEDQVRILRERAVAHTLLADIKAVGPATLGVLGEKSAASIKSFYAASADWSEAQLRLLAARMDDVRLKAESFARHVAESARTESGRQALADEAKGFAARTASAAREQAQRAAKSVDATRKDIAAKAQDLGKKAPDLVLQAEEALKKAEERVVQAARQAETVLRQESQKVRARAEAAVKSAKRRLDRTD